MILALTRAEIIKATRQRGTFFSAYLLVPGFTTFLSLVLSGGILPKGQSQAAIPLLHSIARSLSVGGNPIAQLFFALGAASIFTVDYRYSGWRHIVPRASRHSILCAKALSSCMFAAASLLLVASGEAVVNILMPVARGMKPIVMDLNEASFMLLVGAFAVSLAELLSLVAIVATIATVTRSMMAAVLVSFLLSLVASSAEAYIGTSLASIPLPTCAADTLRANLNVGTWLYTMRSIITLTGWCTVGFALAIGLFQRQDLVEE